MLIVGVKCDKCEKTVIQYGHTTKTYIVRLIRAKGWSVGKGNNYAPEKTLCPQCRNDRRKKNESI